MPDGTRKGYFYTGIREEKEPSYVMCDTILPHEISKASFWRVSKSDLWQGIKDETITLWE